MHFKDTYIVAGLLGLLSAVKSIPFQQVIFETESGKTDLRAQCDAHSSTGADLIRDDYQILTKRSPTLPIEMEISPPLMEQPGTSTQAGNPLPANNYLSSTPEDFLPILDKSLRSALKNEDVPSINGQRFTANEKAMKWLNRAGGSFIGDQEIFSETMKYYLEKLKKSQAIGDVAGEARARTKGQAWETISQNPPNAELYDAVKNVGNRYAQDLQDVLHEMEMNANNRIILLGMKPELQNAEEVYKLWMNADKREAMMMVDMELERYMVSSHWYRMAPTENLRKEMIDHAAKAVAWNIRARQAEIEKNEYLEREGGVEGRNKRQRH